MVNVELEKWRVGKIGLKHVLDLNLGSALKQTSFTCAPTDRPNKQKPVQ